MADPVYTVASDSETSAEERASPAFPEIAIGIDIGTSQCSVAIWNGSELEILNIRNQKTMQCFVSFKDEGPIGGISGQLSLEDEMQSGAAVFNVKRLIGRVDTDPIIVDAHKSLPFLVQTLSIGARPFIAAFANNVWRSTTPEEVLAIFLVQLRAVVEMQLKRSVRNVVLTVPVSFNRFQLTRIARACAMAGLQVLRLMPEPTAVALLYAQQQLQAMREGTGSGSEKLALIFNMGAGYCDVAITATAGGVSQIRALSGSAIGGEDLLQNMMHTVFPSYDGISSNTGINDVKAMALLRVATQNAIYELSFKPTAQINVDMGNGHDIARVVSREIFENVNKKVFDRCESLIMQCLNDAKIEAKDLADVILVGGCSCIPEVRNLVSRVCKREEFYGGINPLEAAVCGAALEGAVASGISDPFGNLDLLTIQATPLSIGIRADGNSFVPIIPRNTTTPVRKELVFTTIHDNQPGALIVVYEGEKSKIEENHLLGYFKITGIPPAPKGVPEIIVWMDIGANNMLRVMVEVVLPGNNQPVTPPMEVRMPSVEDGHGWCVAALNKTYGSTLDLITLQRKPHP